MQITNLAHNLVVLEDAPLNVDRVVVPVSPRHALVYLNSKTPRSDVIGYREGGRPYISVDTSHVELLHVGNVLPIVGELRWERQLEDKQAIYCCETGFR